MKDRLQVDSHLVRGSGGVYKVWVDEHLIWDKRAQGRFPEEAEILSEVGRRKPG